MKEILIHYMQLKGSEVGLTDIRQNSYAGRRFAMAQDIIDPNEEQRLSTPDSRENRRLKEAKRIEIEARINSEIRVTDDMREEKDIADWEEKVVEERKNTFNALIKQLKKTLPKGVSSPLLEEAKDYKRLFTKNAPLKKLLRLGRNIEESPEDLQKVWFSLYSQEQLKDPDLRATINAAIALGHKPADITSKGRVHQTVKDVRDNSLLDDEERKIKAQEILDRLKDEQIVRAEESVSLKDGELTEAQKRELINQAIIRAHDEASKEIGKDGKTLSGVYNLTPDQLRRKVAILRQAGLSPDQTRAIIEAGIAGRGSEGGREDDEKRENNSESETPKKESYSFEQGMLDLNNPENHSDAALTRLGDKVVGIVDVSSKEGQAKLAEFVGVAQNFHRLNAIKAQKEGRRSARSLEQSPGYRPEDEVLYTGDLNQRIEARMERILSEGDQHAENKDIYFNDLKRYVNYALRSVERGELELKQETFSLLNEIHNSDRKYMSDEKLKEYTRQLRDQVHLQDYFKGVGYEIEAQSGSLPSSVEQLAELIVQNYGREFATGEEYELLNINNELQVQNFLKWMRDRIVEQDDNEPFGQINPLSGTVLQAEYSSVSLIQMVLTPRYGQTVPIEIIGKEGEGTEARHADNAEEHKGFTELKYKMLIEAWLAGLDHNYKAGYFAARGQDDKIAEVVAGFYRNNDFGRGNNLFHALMLPSADREEFDANKDFNAQGSVGRGIQQLLASYYHLSDLEWTAAGESDRVKDETEKAKKDKHLKVNPLRPHNMFEKLMTNDGKDPTALRTFYLSLAADGLSSQEVARDEYLKFIKFLFLQEAKKYQGTKNSEAVTQIVEHRISELGQKRNPKKPDDIKVRLDYMKELEVLKEEIHRKINKTGVTKLIRKDIQTSVREDVNRHVKDDFLMKLQGKISFIDKKEKASSLGLVKTVDMSKFDVSKVNEDFALSVIQATHGYKRVDLNYFRAKRPEYGVVNMVQKAMQNAICDRVGLAEHEANYASMWAKNFLNWTGIEARNDTGAIGFDAWSKVINFQQYRERQFQERSQGGNIHNLPGIKSLSMTMWDGVNVYYKNRPSEVSDIASAADPAERERRLKEYQESGEQTFLELLQGGEGAQVNMDKGIKIGEMQALAMQDFADTHLGNAFKLYHLIVDEVDIHLDAHVKEDPWGNIIIDQKTLQEKLDKWHKGIRYCFDQLGFDYNQKVVYRGQEMTLREYFFNKDIINLGLNDQRDIYKNDPNKRWKNDDGTDKRMARNVWGYLIGKEIEAHISSHRTHEKWSSSQIYLIRELLKKVGVDVEMHQDGNSEMAHISVGQFTDKEFELIMKMINSSLSGMFRKEIGVGLLTSLLIGVGKASKVALKEMKPAA